jgi:hypothetical protein
MKCHASGNSVSIGHNIALMSILKQTIIKFVEFQEGQPGFKKSAEFAKIRRIRQWPIFQNYVLFTQKKSGTVPTKISTVHTKFVENLESARCDFFQPTEFLNTGANYFTTTCQISILDQFIAT